MGALHFFIQVQSLPAPPAIMMIPSLDRVLDAVLRIDTNGEIKFVSDRGRKWLQFKGATTIPRNFIDLVHEDDRETFESALREAGEQAHCDIRLIAGQLEHWVNIRSYSLATPGHHVLCLIDISIWKREGAALRRAAEHDELTDLPNRTLLQKLAEKVIQQDRNPFSLVLLDLDGFKKVNDTYGHATGDSVLLETKNRLQRLMAESDILARLGGDVFVMLLKGKSAVDSQLSLKNVLQAIARPYDAAPHNAYLGVSIGVAEYPLHGDDYSTLLKNADTAMHFSKNEGRNRVTVFAPSKANIDFSIKAAIHNGIQEGEFYMDYQPQFNTERRIIGAEALMRWNNKTMGRVGPDQFIPIVEDAGLMSFLGRWALRYACHQLKKFHQFDPNFVMSINVSPVQFNSDNFDLQVIEAIDETGVDPSRLVMEITESTLMGSQEKIEKSLARLRELGVQFSIDDFGTGFSSLSYLTRLPVSSLKIDKAFVFAMEQNPSGSSANKKLITAMINLAHSIDLEVVAEGVETETQFAFLKSVGCNLIQGYLLGRPTTALGITNLLTSPVSLVA